MPATERELTNTMTRLKRRLRDEQGFTGIGIGLVNGEPGIVVSVEAAAAERARQVVAQVDPKVPVSIRTVGTIRKRSAD